MKQLFLHIGMHKTGSTAIQKWLTENRIALKEQGVWYGATDRKPSSEQPKHTSLYHALIQNDRGFDEEKTAILQDFEASGCHTLILSEEGLSQPAFTKLQRIKELRETFDIKVICFLRRQDYFTESWWNQRSKEQREVRSISDFAASNFCIQRTNYLEILDFWSTVADVKAIAFDESGKQDSVEAFAKVCCLPHQGDHRFWNISPSMNCAALCCFLNRHRIPYNAKHLVTLFSSDQRRYALGSELRAQILASHQEDNKLIAEKYSVVFGTNVPSEVGAALRFPSLGSLTNAAIAALRELITKTVNLGSQRL